MDVRDEIFKETNWGSSERGWNRWMVRNLFMSARLFALLESVGVKGMDVRSGDAKSRKQRQKDHAAWVAEKTAELAAAGIPLEPPGKVPRETDRWFKEYLNRERRPEPLAVDAKAAAKRLNCRIPPSVLEFLTVVGPRSYADVDEQEGFMAHILPLEKWETAGFREFEQYDGTIIDGVMFEATEHGDCWCFNVKEDRKEYAVYLFNHEMNQFEVYAESFPQCLRRFMQASM